MDGLEITRLAYVRANMARFSIIFEQAIHRCNKGIGAVQCNFLTDIFDFVSSRFV